MTQRWRIEPETASWNHESSSERNDVYLSYAAQTRSPMIKNIHATAEIKNYDVPFPEYKNKKKR